MTYVPRHFKPHELVPPEVFDELGGDPVKIARLFDDRFLITLDRLHDRYGTATVNNWHWGGDRQESGYRSFNSSTGARWSDHKFGRAGDLLFKYVTAAQVRSDILADPYHRDFEYITCLEMTLNTRSISWLHFATRNWNKNKNGIMQLNL